MASAPVRDSHKGVGPKAKKSSKILSVESKVDTQPQLMTFTEKCGDLFTSPPTASLAHCVSEDLHMGKGIATIFKKEFGRVGELKAQGVKSGGVAVIQVENRYIYYLVSQRFIHVTKVRYSHKPSYQSLTASLMAMKDHVVTHGVSELCMPRIGCGLDRLSWEKVTDIIHEVFKDVPINITVYYL